MRFTQLRRRKIRGKDFMSFYCTVSGPIVETTGGKLRGFTLDGVETFLGIKYADAKRFHMPQPVLPWNGVRDADGYGFTCPIMYEDAPGQELRYAHRYWPSNENCQYLNVWTKDTAGKRPVMIWIHGGGFSFGSCLELSAVNGDSLCRNGDVVVVTLNHRLNILGFFDLSAYGEEYKNTANLGLADLVAALKWVKENISAFGGDADNITLFGQSGGGAKIRALMQIPEAAGLFHKAIVQSGVYDPSDKTPAGERLPREMLRALGAGGKTIKPDAQEIKTLEKLPYRELVALYDQAAPKLEKEGYFTGWQPKPDDYYIGDGVKVGFTAFARSVPTMSGVTMSEFMYGNLPKDSASLSEEDIDRRLRRHFGSGVDELKRLYREAYPDHPLCDILALDSRFCYPNMRFLDAKAAQSEAATYSYVFSYDFPLYDKSPAWHCSEIPFVYHNIREIPVCGEPIVCERLQEQMCTAWTDFAKYGNPNCAVLPDWEPYTTGHEVTMVFDRTCRTAVRHARELLTLHYKTLKGELL